MYETDIPLGEMTILSRRVHGAINTLIQPYEEPGDWSFKQFPSMEMAKEFALEHKLIIKMEQTNE